MKLIGINKKDSGKFLNYYHLHYKNTVNDDKIYEMISRNKNIKRAEDLSSAPADAVIIIAFNKERNKMLLLKEFRMAVNDYVYDTPAGLIDEGETPLKAAIRELYEETGLEFTTLIDFLPPAYSAVGISNEKTIVVLNVGAVYLFSHIAGSGITTNMNIVSTMSTIVLIFTGLAMLYRLCKPFNAITTTLFVSMLTLCVACILIAPTFFGLMPFSALALEDQLFIIILSMASPTIINILYKVMDKVKI